MFSLICNMLRISAGTCSMIILWHSLLMQPHRAILQSLIYHILQLFMGKSRLFQLSMHAVLCLPSLCGSHKEVCMEIREALSFYYSRVKHVTLQELLTKNTRSLIRDSKKIAKKSRVIKNECHVWVELYRITINTPWWPSVVEQFGCLYFMHFTLKATCVDYKVHWWWGTQQQTRHMHFLHVIWYVPLE